MQTTTSLTFFTAMFVALGGALAEELMICCRHVRTELYRAYIDYESRYMSSIETSENNVYRRICFATDVRNVVLKIAMGIYKNSQIPTLISIR